MSLAHPFGLLGLLLLPLLIALYLWRAQHQRRVVSSTWLWEEAISRITYRPARRLPLREPLLAVQLLAALVLTLVLTGPVLQRSAHQHRIVVLDASVAMAATDRRPTRFVQALGRIRSLLNGLEGSDRLSLIVAGSQARYLGDAPGTVDLYARLVQLPPPAGAADLQGAAALVRGLAAANGEGTPVVIFLSAAETPALPLAGLGVQTERYGAPLDDRAIALLAVRCSPSPVSCEAFARIRNSADHARSVPLTVRVDEHILGTQTLAVPPVGSLDLAFPLPPGARVVQAQITSGDSLAADDVAWAVVPSSWPLRALLASDDPGELPRALRVTPGLRVDTITTSNLAATPLDGYDLVILDGTVPDILPPNPLLVLRPPPGNALVSLTSLRVYLPVGQVDARDPMVAGLDLFHLTITGSSIAIPSWSQVAVGGPRGPIILHGILAGQRIVVLPWDAGHRSIASDAVFPVLLDRMIRWLVPTPPASVVIGAHVALPPDIQSVRDPHGALLQGPVIKADAPGVYRVTTHSGARATGEPMFATSSAVAGDIAPAQSIAAQPIPVRGGGSLPLAIWMPALVAALVLLCAEWWLYARRS